MAKEKDKSRNDDLADVIAESLNKMHKDGQVAYILENEESPTDFTDFISTGSTLLDLAISNRPNGGVACGRITELQGLEGSGKSLIAAHMIADTQRRGGVAVLIDTENAVNRDFFDSVGVDWAKLVYAQLSTTEDIFESTTNIIETVRKKDKKRLVLIVIDSLAAASTIAEMEADFDRDGYATGKAQIISKALRKITQLIGKERIAMVITNQLRQKLNAPAFSDPWTTPGGKALGFHSTTRVRLSVVGKIKNTDDVVVGVKFKGTVLKSRLGPPYRTAEAEVYFDRGIDDNNSVFEAMQSHGLLEEGDKRGQFVIRDATGKKIPFARADWPAIYNEDAARRTAWYTLLCEKIIMAYKKSSVADGTAVVIKSEGLEGE